MRSEKDDTAFTMLLLFLICSNVVINSGPLNVKDKLRMICTPIYTRVTVLSLLLLLAD